MQSEQCYRQWRKVRKGGGLAGLAMGGGLSLGVASVEWEDRCRWRAPVAAWAGGVGRGWVGAGGRGAGKKARQALEARRLRHAERTVLPAVAQSKKRGGWRVWRGWGPSLGVASVAWLWPSGAIVGGGGCVWQGQGCGGAVWRAESGAACWGGGAGRSKDFGSELGPPVCGGVRRWGVCPATGLLLRGSGEDVERVLHGY